MILFTRKRIFCAVLIISTIVFCESTPTNIGNLTQNEDATLQSELCDASKNDCKNGAKCERQGNYTLCACRNGTKGDFCEIVQDCENLLFCELSQYAYCQYDESKEAAACYCTETRFYNTKQKVCAKLCDVSKNDCKNGGKCEKHENYTFCSCRNGTYGEFCEHVRECPSLLCGIRGEAYCYFDESKGTAACKCIDGTFYNAEKKICTGGCDPNPCHNGGACYVYEGKGICHCNLPAFAGAYCESEAKTLIVVYCVVAACIFVAIIGSCWAFRNKLKNLRAIFIKPKVDNTDNACNENQ